MYDERNPEQDEDVEGRLADQSEEGSEDEVEGHRMRAQSEDPGKRFRDKPEDPGKRFRKY